MSVYSFKASQVNLMIRNGIRTDLDGSLRIPDNPGLVMKAVKASHHPHGSWVAPRITGSGGKKKDLSSLIFFFLQLGKWGEGRGKKLLPS